MTRRSFTAIAAVIMAVGALRADDPPKTHDSHDVATLVRLLTEGDPSERLEALRQVGPQLKRHPDLLLPAMIECAEESDPRLRAAAITIIGQQLIWVDGPQNQRAIDFALKMSHDDDPDVVHACVYFCLSTVSQKSEAVIDRLIQLACEHEPSVKRELSRVVWGLRGQQGLAAQRIQAHIDRLDGDTELAPCNAVELFYRLTGAVPDRIERFSEQGEFVILVGLSHPFQPKSRDDVVAILRKLVGDDAGALDIRAGVERHGAFAMILVKGLGPYTRLLKVLDSTEGLKKAEATIITPELRPRVEELLRRYSDSKDIPPETTSYEAAFRELYERLGSDYPNFELKGIDWKAVGAELLPASRTPMSTSEFSLLCQRLVARLEDSHAFVGKGTAQPVSIPWPRWDPGFACLIDDQDRPVIFAVQPNSPASERGLRPGSAILSINGTPTAAALRAYSDSVREYVGYSSDQLLRHDAARGFHRQPRRGAIVQLELETADGMRQAVELPGSLENPAVPRLPVPIPGINESADLSYKRLEDGIGYIYVRRIRQNLIESLDRAVADLRDCPGLILDVRGNSGGGFDAERSFRNFDPQDRNEPERPRFLGPIAVLIDSRCISAGEGWISWFKAKNRARFFGETTAGASSRKNTIDVAGGLFQVTYSVKAYQGFLDRPIERVGIEPDVPVRPSAQDLSGGVDTVLESARRYLAASAQDPKETTDLAAQQPERVAKMKAALDAWKASVQKSLAGDDYGPRAPGEPALKKTRKAKGAQLNTGVIRKPPAAASCGDD